MVHLTVEQTRAQIDAATSYIKGRLPQGEEVQVCIVCGSGLGGLADTLENVTAIDYSDIPHFASATGINPTMLVISQYSKWLPEIHHFYQ